jgi:glyoxylase-like metal-dependent hydrolase (beta-lactamase superfamily II)
MLLPDATPQFLQQFGWLVPHFATPEGKMIISFQCFVLRSKGRTVMIDTCIGNDRQREFDVFCNLQSTFLEDLATAGFPAEEVTDVLCTHLHFDHVGWNTQLVDGKWVPTFPQARYLFGRSEFHHWQHLRDTDGYHHMGHLADSIDPVMEAGLVEFIEPDFRVTSEVSLIATPGHTPGHVSVLIESRGQSAVITGDLMHNPVQIAIPATEARFDMDKAQAARTRSEFVQRFNGTNTLVIGSHFADPTAGHIVPDGNAWKLKV